MANIGSMSVTLRADTNAFTRGLLNARKGLAGFSKSVSSAVFSLKGFGVALATGAIAQQTREVLNFADSIDEASQKVGMSVEELHKLSYAAKLNGVEFQGLVGSLTKMNLNLASAAEGGGPAAKALEQLGLSANQLTAMTQEQQFLALIDGMSKLGTVGERTAAAVAVFGRAGAALVPMINQGAAGVNAMTAELDRMGATLTSDTAAAAASANDAIDKLSMTLSATFATAVVALAPVIEDTATALTAFFAETDNINMMTTAVNSLVVAFQGVGVVVSGVHALFTGLRSAVTGGLTSIVQYLDAAAEIADVVVDFGTTPIGGELPPEQRSRMGERLNILRSNLERTSREQQAIASGNAARTAAAASSFANNAINLVMPAKSAASVGMSPVAGMPSTAPLPPSEQHEKDRRLQQQQLHELKAIANHMQGVGAAAAAF